MEFIQKAEYTCKSSNKDPTTRQKLFFFFSLMGMHALCAGNIANNPNALSSVMEKSSYISSKTNILSSYLILSSCSLIPNHIMIHWDFFASFNFSFLMSFVNFSPIWLYSVMVTKRSILIPSSTPDLSWIYSGCVLCGLGALQTSRCSAPVLLSMPWYVSVY